MIATRELREGQSISRIVQLDVRSNQIVDLFSGSAAWFVPEGKFYVIDDGRRLLARGRRGSVYSDLVIAEHRQGARMAVTLVDNQELLYAPATGSGIRLFNVRTGRDIGLDSLSSACVLNGAVWVESRRQLLCRAPQESDYRLVSLAGEHISDLPLPDEERLEAVAYLAGQNAVILTSVGHGPLSGNIKNRVWMHDLATGETHRLADDQYLGNSVAWGE